MASQVRDVARERRWRDVLRRFARSGLEVRAFCRREMLAESAFYFWRREIAHRNAEMPKPSGPARRARPRMTRPRMTMPRTTLRPQALPRRSQSRLARQPSFLPVHLTDAAARETSITLELAGGRLLRLPEMIPAQRLAEIVAALEATGITARTAS